MENEREEIKKIIKFLQDNDYFYQDIAGIFPIEAKKIVGNFKEIRITVEFPEYNK